MLSAGNHTVAHFGRIRLAGGPLYGKRAFHKGIDLACAEGTGILAVQGGIVLRTKRGDSYGSCMELLLADGTAAVYAHLQYIYVRPGEAVEAGQDPRHSRAERPGHRGTSAF